MGRGDQRTKRGKIFRGTHGRTHLKKNKKKKTTPTTTTTTPVSA